MKIPKKRCQNCHLWFEPYPPKRNIQRFCARQRCQRERHRQGCAAFYRADPHCDEQRREKIRTWARRRDYWRWYRQNHPGYRVQDNARRQLAKKAAKRDAWKTLAVEKLRDIQGQAAEKAAKRDAWDPRVDAVLAYLVWKERPQNETVTAGSGV